MKISCKTPDIAFVSNSTRKHRQGIGIDILPWNVASIQISSLSLSLSLSHSLSRLLPPSHALESSSSKVNCAGPGWHISARRAVKSFHQDFPSVVQTPIKYESLFPEITPLFVWRYSTLHNVPLSYPCQPFTLTDNHLIAIAFYMVTDLTPRSTSFQPPTHKGPSENSLLCSTTHVCDQVCEVAGEVDLSTLSNGSLEMKSLTLQVSVNWHLRRCLRTFQQGLNDNGTEFKDSVL